MYRGRSKLGLNIPHCEHSAIDTAQVSHHSRGAIVGKHALGNGRWHPNRLVGVAARHPPETIAYASSYILRFEAFCLQCECNTVANDREIP